MTIAQCRRATTIGARACAIDDGAGIRNLVRNVDEPWFLAEDDLGGLWQLCQGYQFGNAQ